MPKYLFKEGVSKIEYNFRFQEEGIKGETDNKNLIKGGF